MSFSSSFKSMLFSHVHPSKFEKRTLPGPNVPRKKLEEQEDSNPRNKPGKHEEQSAAKSTEMTAGRNAANTELQVSHSSIGVLLEE